MSRSSVVVLLALCVSLLGSTCEFRASSGKHDHEDGESGVSVIVDTRVGGSSGGTAAGGFDPAEIVQAALATSGAPPLPAPAPLPGSAPGQGAASAPVPVPAPGLAPVAAPPAEGAAVGAIPEPSAAWLFGLGLALAGVARRRRRRRS